MYVCTYVRMYVCMYVCNMYETVTDGAYARFTLGCNHDLTKWLDRSLTDWNHEILVAVGSHWLDDFSGRPDFWFDRWLHGPKKYDSGDKIFSRLHRPM